MGAWIVIIRIICLGLNIYIAGKKNRSMAVWAILGLIFAWLSLIILLLLRPKELPYHQADDNYPYHRSQPSLETKQTQQEIPVKDSFSSTLKDMARKTRKVSTNCKACGAPLIGRHDQFVICEYCGTGVRLDEDEAGSDSNG